MDDDLVPNFRPASPMTEQTNGYDYDMDGARVYGPIGLGRSFRPGSDDAIRTIEESILGDPSRHRVPGLVLRSQGKEMTKRHALSEGSSDHEGSGLKRDRVPANKRRRVDASGVPGIIDHLERSITADLSASALKVLGPSVKGKGKSKLVQQRELSYDSMSMTPGGRRRRPGPKKKFDCLPSERLDLLGLTYAGGSPSGDASPALSRPASPAAVMSIVYELDDLIPPLKRAKKVDDVAMLKRVKALEEAQRKVWTNIARRDVAKVRYVLYIGLFTVDAP